MTRYFMRDTPLHQMEQQMMTPPNFKPRGHGQYHPGFRYKPEDVACQYCRHYDRKQCSLDQCPYLPERVEAGVLDLYVLLKELFSPDVGQQLRERMKQKLTHYFLNDAHRKRWTHRRNRYYKMSDRNKAALFLLTAYEDIWRRVIWKFDSDGFDFKSVRLSGIQPELYSVYPDGSYTPYTWLLDCWTPAGMLSVNLTDSVRISGELWEEWHVAPTN